MQQRFFKPYEANQFKMDMSITPVLYSYTYLLFYP